MADSKVYLSVPFPEKDEAKALGARWDPTNKKWYILSSVDNAPFSKWQSELVSPKAKNKPHSQKTSSKNRLSANHEIGTVTTYPTNKDFVAYNGDESPWE